MCKKDSSDRELYQGFQASSQLRRIGAILVGQKHERTWRQMDQGVPHDQGCCGIVEKGCLTRPGTGERDGNKSTGLRGCPGLGVCKETLARAVMIIVGFHDLQGSGGQGLALRPLDRVEKGCGVAVLVGGGPKFGFAGGIVSVPSGESLPILLERLWLQAQRGRVAA